MPVATTDGRPVGDGTALPVAILNGSPTGGGLATTPGPATLSTQTFTIANGASLSAAVDLASLGMIDLIMPAAWTAAVLTFQESPDGATYTDLYDAFGTEYTVQAAASRTIVISPADFPAVRFLKIRSGTAGVPVNQGASRTITAVVRAI